MRGFNKEGPAVKRGRDVKGERGMGVGKGEERAQ